MRFNQEESVGVLAISTLFAARQVATRACLAVVGCGLKLSQRFPFLIGGWVHGAQLLAELLAQWVTVVGMGSTGAYWNRCSTCLQHDSPGPVPQT